MKPAGYDYVAAASVDEAIAELLQPGSVLLAGGQSLVPLMNARLARPQRLIDINAVPGLDAIDVAGDLLTLGALVRVSELERDPQVGEHAPGLAEAAARIGFPAVRNRGTVGGNLAFADPDGTLGTVMLALEATYALHGPGGERTLSAAEFAGGAHVTALAPGELLTAVTVPRAPGSAFAEIAERQRGWSLANAAAVVALDDAGAVTSVRLTVGGLRDVPVTLDAVAGALRGSAPSQEAIAAAVGPAVAQAGEPRDDARASGTYRRHLAAVAARRALASAVQRALRT